MKVLHITNWYPNKFEPYETLFVKEHFDSLKPYTDGFLLHLQIRNEKKLFKFHSYKISDVEKAFILETRLKIWKAIELLNFIFILYFLWKYKYKRFDVLNFHIAYPQLTYLHWIKKIIKKPIVITEHWSAYRLNFNLSKDSSALKKIKNIFLNNVPVLTVSRSLFNDIVQFAGTDKIKNYIVPNVIDDQIFNYREVVKEKFTFFTVNHWKEIKNPIVLLMGWKAFVADFPNGHLRIGGYGPLWEKMIDFVKDNNLQDSVTFLGKLNKAEISDELNRAHGFLYSSSYETFSVVCAEAVSCGTPVLGPFIPAIAEYINESNGIFLESTAMNEWKRGLQEMVDKHHVDYFQFKDISKNAHSLFSKGNVGKKYTKALQEVIDSYEQV